jgi:hypothetical protein
MTPPLAHGILYRLSLRARKNSGTALALLFCKKVIHAFASDVIVFSLAFSCLGLPSAK